MILEPYVPPFDNGDDTFMLLSGHRTRTSGMLIGLRFDQAIYKKPCDTYVAVYRKKLNNQFTAQFERIGSTIKLVPDNAMNTSITRFISNQTVYVLSDDLIALYVPTNTNCEGGLVKQAVGNEEILVYSQAAYRTFGIPHPPLVNQIDTILESRDASITFMLAGKYGHEGYWLD